MKINKNVVIYTTNTCYYCKLAKEYFSRKEIPFIEHDVTQDNLKSIEMVKLTGQMGVPVIVIGDNIVVGFKQDELEKLLEDDI